MSEWLLFHFLWADISYYNPSGVSVQSGLPLSKDYKGSQMDCQCSGGSLLGLEDLFKFDSTSSSLARSGLKHI